MLIKSERKIQSQVNGWVDFSVFGPSKSREKSPENRPMVSVALIVAMLEGLNLLNIFCI